MNMFHTQRVRDTHKVSWQQEYILGMISHLGPMNSMRVLNLCAKQKIMSPATAHKYLKLNASKKLLATKRSSVDKREIEFDVTPKAITFLEDIKHASR